MLERLPGTDLGHVINDLSAHQRANVARDVAAAQRRAAREATVGRFGYAVAPPDAQHERWTGVVHASLDRSHRRIKGASLFDVEAVARVRAVVRARARDLDRCRSIAFLHDTTTKNVIVHEGRVSGIVDVDDLCFGDPLFAPALTLMSILKSGGPLDYIESWLAAVHERADWRMALYVAVFCVDFMSEYGQRFNKAAAMPTPTDAARLYAILDRALIAAESPGEVSISSLGA